MRYIYVLLFGVVGVFSVVSGDLASGFASLESISDDLSLGFFSLELVAFWGSLSVTRHGLKVIFWSFFGKISFDLSSNDNNYHLANRTY